LIIFADEVVIDNAITEVQDIHITGTLDPGMPLV